MGHSIRPVTLALTRGDALIIALEHHRFVNGGDRAVTSTVATVLLVAVVLLVGAVVASVAFDQAEDVSEPPPNAAFTIDTCRSCPSIADPGDTTNYVNVTFETGDPIPAARLSVVIDGTTVFDPTATGPAAYAEPANYDGAGPNALRWSSDRITAGERVVLEDDADGDPNPADRFSAGSTVRVVWTPASGDRSFVLAEQEIPA